MANRTDLFSRANIQTRKNFEQIIESMMDRGLVQYSSDSEDEQIFVGNNFKLYSGSEYIELPKSLLEFDSLSEIFNYESLSQILTQNEINHLMKFLPENFNEQQNIDTLKSLLNAEDFHFGSPLENFMTKCRSGYFTKSRQHCDTIDYKLSILSTVQFQEDLINTFQNPDHLNKIKNKLRIDKIRRQCNDLSEILGKKIRLSENPTDQESTNSSQSEDQDIPESIPQQQGIQQIQSVQIQMVTNTQSLFPSVNNLALPQLPAYTSTSLLTNQMALASLQVKRQIKKVSQGTSQSVQLKPNGAPVQSKMKLESSVPTGQSDLEWLENYRKQEGERYGNPLLPYTFICIDGSYATVAPAAKKLLSGPSSKPRQHELLRNERPPYVTILSLVRDAAARLPKGYGTRADIMNLVKDSQFINETLPEEKMSSIISGALDRLHQSSDPCVKYDQEKKIWIYLHHDRDLTYPEWQLAPSIIQNSSQSKSRKPKQFKIE